MKKNVMKWISLVVAAVMVMGMAACGNGKPSAASSEAPESSVSSESSAEESTESTEDSDESAEESSRSSTTAMTVTPGDESPAAAVALMLDFYTSLDFGLITGLEGIDPTFVESLMDDEMKQMMEIVKVFTKNMTYEIISETIDGTTASVEVEVTTFSGEELLQDMMNAVLGAMMSADGTEMTDEETEAFVLDYLSTLDTSKFAKQVTTITIKPYQNSKGGWVVDYDDETVLSAVMGNIDQLLGNMGY